MRKAVFAAMTAVLTLFMGCSSLPAMSEDDAYLAAMDLYNKKDFEAAGPRLADFYKNFSNSKYKPNVMLKMAELERDFYRAEELYKAVIKDRPDTEFEAEAIQSLARLYYARGEYMKTVEYAGIILGRFSNTIWIEPAYHYRMLALNAQKNYSEAEHLYAQYAQNTGYYLFKNRMKLTYADTLYAQGKFSEAIPFYIDVINAADTEKYIYAPDVYVKIAACYKNTGNTAQQEKYYYDLKAKYPDSAEAKAGGAVKPVYEEPAETVEAIKPEPTKATAAKSGRFFTVQIGAYTNDRLANDTAKRLGKKGFYVFTKTEGKYIKVMVGKEETRAAAEKTAASLVKKDSAIKSYLIKEGWE